MILAFNEDGTLRLHESEEDAVSAWEGVDVENGVVTFYAEDGTYLEPVFTVPNRYGRLLGLFPWCESGQYHLVPNPNAREDPLWLALYEHPVVEGFGAPSLDELKRHLASKGAVVERPPD